MKRSGDFCSPESKKSKKSNPTSYDSSEEISVESFDDIQLDEDLLNSTITMHYPLTNHLEHLGIMQKNGLIWGR
jgi:hypothetical protein